MAALNLRYIFITPGGNRLKLSRQGLAALLQILILNDFKGFTRDIWGSVPGIFFAQKCKCMQLHCKPMQSYAIKGKEIKRKEIKYNY